MSATLNKNFHLPLPPALYADLRAAAERMGAPATDLAREAIQVWLKQERRRQIHAELSAYAQAVAGSRDDFDPAVSAAGAQHFLASTPHDDWSAEPSFPGGKTSKLGRNSAPNTVPKTAPGGAPKSTRAPTRKSSRPATTTVSRRRVQA